MTNDIRSTASIKQQNIKSIKRAILKKGAATKPEVAEITGLSVVTCGSILNELTAEGVIIEEAPRVSSGGRPAMSYRFSEDTGNALCIFTYTESEGPYIRYQVIDIAGNIKEAGVSKEKSITVKSLAGFIQKICRQSLNIKIVELGIQGCINNEIVEFSDLAGISGVNLAQKISSEIGIPVQVENDMNTVALGYSLNEAKRNGESNLTKNLAILFFPRGQTPAGGFIVDGHILRGTSNLAGELSFFPFSFEGGRSDKDSQRAAFSDIEYAQPVINQLLTATSVFLDPSVIVITGGLASEMDAQALQAAIKRRLLRDELPKIEIRPQVESEYFMGLHSLAVDYMIDG